MTRPVGDGAPHPPTGLMDAGRRLRYLAGFSTPVIPMYRHTLPLLFLLASLLAPIAARADAEGQQLAERCTFCHGQQGQSPLPGVPRIGGRDFYDLLARMARYRSGEHPHPVMSLIMQTLDEADMAEVADYFAATAPRAN